jgi:hypothetical protein
VTIPLSAVAFARGTNVIQAFHRIRLLRHTAVHRLVQDSSTIKRFIQDAILIVEGLRDGPRTRKLHDICNALISGDLDAIWTAVKTPLEYFDMPDMPRLSAPFKSLPLEKRSTHTNGQHNVASDNHPAASAASLYD